MKSYIYVYRESALSALTPKQRAIVCDNQGRFDGWRILHVSEKIPGEFPNKSALIAEADNDVYLLIKSEVSFDYDVLSSVLDFGKSLHAIC